MTARRARPLAAAAAVVLVGAITTASGAPAHVDGSSALQADRASVPTPGAAGTRSTIRRATARLANRSFTRFTESGSSSFDQRLHLCRDKSFIYDTVSSSTGTTRVEGRWRVTSARIRGRVWTARVRGTASDGSGSLTVKFRTNGSRTKVDGNLVFVERSDLC